MTSNLEWLQKFYLSLCDGEWEHGYGFAIDNCDNPGWLFKFELTDTVYAQFAGPEISLGEHQLEEGHDWLVLKREDTSIKGACGPLKLDALLGEFRGWIGNVDAALESERSLSAKN